MVNGKKNLSKEEDDNYLDALFSALSDRKRRGVLDHLSKNGASVSELAEAYNMTLAGMMKHLKVLEKAELVYLEKTGRVRSCSFNPEGLQGAEFFINKYKDFWNDKFDKLEDILKKN